MKYEGDYAYRWRSLPIHGGVDVVFDEYVTPDKNSIKGRIAFILCGVKVERPFVVAIDGANTAAFSASGLIDNVHMPSDENSFFNIYGNVNSGNAFWNLIKNECHIAIRFADGKMSFFIGSSPASQSISLSLTETVSLTAARKREIEGTWQYYRFGQLRHDVSVKYNTTTDQYDMTITRSHGAVRPGRISDIRYNGETWSFYVCPNYITKFTLKKVNATTFEGTEGSSETRWVRIGN